MSEEKNHEPKQATEPSDVVHPAPATKPEPLDPKRDIVFKRIFGDERNKALLLDLLNAILEGTLPLPIEDVEILSPTIEKDAVADKLSILDLKLRDQAGRLYDVEMQCENRLMFVERILYYWSKLCASQLKSGINYTQLRPVISIVLADFKMLAQEPASYRSHFVLKEKSTNVELTDMMALHIIELPRFTKSAQESKTSLEQWLTFFQEGMNLPTNTIEEWKHPAIEEAAKELEKLAGDDQFRWEYIAREKFIRDHATEIVLRYQKGIEEGKAIGIEQGREQGKAIGIEQGIEEGKAIGIKKGREQGKAIGIEQGREEAQKELAQTLQKAGQTVAQIAAMMGHSESKIEAWLSELKETP